jgi:Fe-S oxidoreductase
MLSKGFLRPAREMVHRQVHRLARQLEDGVPLLGLEPSCILTIADDWPDLYPNADTNRVAAAANLAEHWLAARAAEGRFDLHLVRLDTSCVVHGHCHQKALVGVKGSADALRLIPGLKVHVLDTGCCGMAGSFGFEKEHYDLSVAIANLSVLPSLASYPDSIVIAPGTSCRHQIRDLAGRRARHPLEVLNEQLVD